MKIIGCSNFNLDTVSDILIADNVNKQCGEKIVKFLQSESHSNDTYYPFLVEDDHKLYDASVIY